MANHREFEQALRAWAAVFMRRSVHEFFQSMKDSGLSPSQLNTLMRLHYRGSCPVSGIGDELGLTAAAASQIVDRLASQGLIERTEDPSDRRVRNVTLTTKGRGMVARGLEARVGWVRRLGRSFDPDELAAIVDALHQLTRAAGALETGGEREPATSQAET